MRHSNLAEVQGGQSAPESAPEAPQSIAQRFAQYANAYLRVGPEGVRYRVTVDAVGHDEASYAFYTSEPKTFSTERNGSTLLHSAVDRALWSKAVAQGNVLSPSQLEAGFDKSTGLRESETWKANIARVMTDPEVADRWHDAVKTEIEALLGTTGEKRTRQTAAAKDAAAVAAKINDLI